MLRFFTVFVILVLSACTTSADRTSQAERANTRKTLTALAKTPAIKLSNTATPSNTDTPTLTILFTEPPLERTETPLPAFTPTESETITWTPSFTYTETASITPSMLPTSTPQNLPIEVHNEVELRICTQIQGVDCRIVGNISLTSQLLMQTANVTVRGGSITNDVNYPDRLVMIARTADIHLENVTIYGTIATVKSSVKDCLLVLDSARITLDHVTLMYCEDENLDIVGSVDILITNSVVMQPLHCAMHSKGCHGYASLITNSAVTIRDSVICCAKARMPEIQNSRVIMERVLLDDLDGSAVSVQCSGVLDIHGSILRGGFDTDDLSYGIVTPHSEDCLPAGLALPMITEKCTLVVNWHIGSNGDKYPRVRRSSTLYTNPITTTEFKSDASGCMMPSEGDMQTTIQNAGSLLTPACLQNGDCRIIDAPPSG